MERSVVVDEQRVPTGAVAALRGAGALFGYLHGTRIALRGQLLLDDDPPARVAWEATTRLLYLEELPFIEASAREHLEAVARRG